MFMQDATRFVADPATPVAAPVRSGLVASTLVETEAGWRPAGDLRRGDRLHTFDGGLRDLVTLDRSWLIPGAGGVLLRLPGGLLHNAADLAVLPDQHILIDTWDEDALPDAVTTLVPALALSGLRGTTSFPVTKVVEVVTPLFHDDEIIYANGGLLLHCPGIETGLRAPPGAGYYPRLGLAQARAVMRFRLPAEPAPDPRPAAAPAPAGWRRFWRAA